MNSNQKRRLVRLAIGMAVTLPMLQGLSCLTDLIPF